MIVVQRAKDFQTETADGVSKICAYSSSFRSALYPEIDTLVSLCTLRVDSGCAFESQYPKSTEVFSYVIDGSVYSESSLGRSQTRFGAGEAYVLSAGKNPVVQEKVQGADQPIEMIQIQLKSKRDDLEPFFEAGTYRLESEFNQLVPIASATGDDGALLVRQNCFVYGALLGANRATSDVLPPGRLGMVYLIKGHLKVGRSQLKTGDAALILDQEDINFRAVEESHFIYMDLPPASSRPV